MGGWIAEPDPGERGFWPKKYAPPTPEMGERVRALLEQSDDRRLMDLLFIGPKRPPPQRPPAPPGEADRRFVGPKPALVFSQIPQPEREVIVARITPYIWEAAQGAGYDTSRIALNLDAQGRYTRDLISVWLRAAPELKERILDIDPRTIADIVLPGMDAYDGMLLRFIEEGVRTPAELARRMVKERPFRTSYRDPKEPPRSRTELCTQTEMVKFIRGRIREVEALGAALKSLPPGGPCWPQEMEGDIEQRAVEALWRVLEEAGAFATPEQVRQAMLQRSQEFGVDRIDLTLATFSRQVALQLHLNTIRAVEGATDSEIFRRVACGEWMIPAGTDEVAALIGGRMDAVVLDCLATFDPRLPLAKFPSEMEARGFPCELGWLQARIKANPEFVDLLIIRAARRSRDIPTAASIAEDLRDGDGFYFPADAVSARLRGRGDYMRQEPGPGVLEALRERAETIVERTTDEEIFFNISTSRWNAGKLASATAAIYRRVDARIAEAVARVAEPTAYSISLWLTKQGMPCSATLVDSRVQSNPELDAQMRRVAWAGGGRVLSGLPRPQASGTDLVPSRGAGTERTLRLR